MLHLPAEVRDGLVADHYDPSAGEGEGLDEGGLGVHRGGLPGSLH